MRKVFAGILLFSLAASIMTGVVQPVSAKKQSKPRLVIGSSRVGLKNGSYQKAEFNEPYSAALYEGKLYITDSANHCIRVADLKTKKVSMLTGTNISGKTPEDLKGYSDAHISVAKFNEPRGIAVDSEGVLYIADTGNHVIRKIKDNRVYTLAGTGRSGNTDGKLSRAEFSRPSDVAVMGDKIFVADTLNASIRRIDKDGTVHTMVQGNMLIEPSGLSVSRDTLYIADSGAQMIFKYKEGDGLTVLAGKTTGKDKQSGYRKWGLRDGKAESAVFNFPKSLVFDKKGLFIADSWNGRIRTLKNGEVETFLKLNGFEPRPTKILSTDRDLIVVDSANHRILFYKK